MDDRKQVERLQHLTARVLAQGEFYRLRGVAGVEEMLDDLLEIHSLVWAGVYTADDEWPPRFTGPDVERVAKELGCTEEVAERIRARLEVEATITERES